MRSSDWQHSACNVCWLQRHPDRQPVRVTPTPNEAVICCYCHIPHTSGIYFREDPTLFDNCQHNVIVLLRKPHQPE
jgi:hypothetical protein